MYTIRLYSFGKNFGRAKIKLLFKSQGYSFWLSNQIINRDGNKQIWSINQDWLAEPLINYSIKHSTIETNCRSVSSKVSILKRCFNLGSKKTWLIHRSGQPSKNLSARKKNIKPYRKLKWRPYKTNILFRDIQLSGRQRTDGLVFQKDSRKRFLKPKLQGIPSAWWANQI